MIRITTLLWVALLFIAGGTVMHVSYQVRHVEQRLSELNRDTRLEQDKLRILGAEWDTLNDPQRIDELSKRHLALEPTPIARVVALDAVPMKLSDDQIAKLAAATPAKGAKAQAAVAQQKAAKRPDVMVKAPAPSRDDVGLILARMEKQE